MIFYKDKFRGRVKKRRPFYYDAWIEKLEHNYQSWYVYDGPYRFFTKSSANRYINRTLEHSTES